MRKLRFAVALAILGLLALFPFLVGVSGDRSLSEAPFGAAVGEGVKVERAGRRDGERHASAPKVATTSRGTDERMALRLEAALEAREEAERQAELEALREAVRSRVESRERLMRSLDLRERELEIEQYIDERRLIQLYLRREREARAREERDGEARARAQRRALEAVHERQRLEWAQRSELEARAHAMLRHLGYVVDEATAGQPSGWQSAGMAIRRFQTDHGLEPTGRVDGNLLKALKAASVGEPIRGPAPMDEEPMSDLILVSPIL
jgi:hypothetical protein